MKKPLFILLFFGLIASAFSPTQFLSNVFKLEPKPFAEKIKTLKHPNIVDIRTDAEFKESHIENAINIDWYGVSFDSEISSLDKSKPLFIYCHSGGRSAAAVEKIKNLGFNEINELAGGISNWKASGYSVTKK